MTEIDRTKWPPPEDEAMLQWYHGAFDQGFIALHPFFTVDGLDPAVCEHGTLVVARSQIPDGVGLVEYMDQSSAMRRQGKELFSGSVSAVARQFGRAVAWREIAAALGVADHCALDRALRTNIMGLRRDLADHAAARALTAHCAREQIFLPTEGVIQPLMERPLVAMLKRAGLNEIIVTDEFGDEELLLPVAALDGDEPWESRDDMPKWGVRRIIAPDRSLLIWVHWDSFYAAIFGTSARLAAARPEDEFEGFRCSQATTTYWLLEDALPLV